MKNSFWRGTDYALKGVRDFYKYKFLWKYAAVPLAVLLVLYGVIFWFTYSYVQPWIVSWAACWPDWLFFSFSGLSLDSVLIFLTWFYTAVITAFISNFIFELVGSFFFPFMVRTYQQQVLKLEPEKLQTSEVIRNNFDLMILNCVIAVLFVALGGLTLVFPFAGILIFFTLIGYQYSMLFMSEACFNCHDKLSDIKYLFMKKKRMLYGFGTWSFVMIQMPLMSIFLYPGFVLGGTLMFCRETDEYF